MQLPRRAALVPRDGDSGGGLSTSTSSPTREGSWAVDDPTATSAEGSPYPSPLPTDDLRAPIPSYFPSVNPHNSMASVASDATSDNADADASSSTAALATTPSELNASVESSASLLHNAHPPAPAARPRPPRGSRSRSRPLSMVSSAGTTYSLQTSHSMGVGMNTLRGPAHSIHSNIQIVLPAPLAPELYPDVRPTDDRISVFGFAAGGSTSRVNSFYGGQPTAAPSQAGGEGDRKSVADPWLSGALAQSRTSVPSRGEREGSPSRSGSSARGSSVGPRPSSASRPRSSLSKMASASSLGDSASAAHRRAQSQPPAPPPLPPHAYSHSQSPSSSPGPSRPPSAPPGNPPPVPRMPMYESAGVPYPISEEGYPHPQPHAYPQPQPQPYPYPQHQPQPQAYEGYAYDEGQGRGSAYAPIPLPAGAAQPVRDPLMQLHMAALGTGPGPGMDMGRGMAAGLSWRCEQRRRERRGREEEGEGKRGRGREAAHKTMLNGHLPTTRPPICLLLRHLLIGTLSPPPAHTSTFVHYLPVAHTLKCDACSPRRQRAFGHLRLFTCCTVPAYE
ncbi:hypothetical protein FKP32DRAFT_1689449 [Trametes sanguinea]|nr:hypothetical protein FKP32DRAFT_1689449 [Trametes sanguinea]